MSKDRRVARDVLPDGKVVSTVKLSDLLGEYGWETAVFAGEESFVVVDRWHYANREDAVAGHAEVVETWAQDPPKRED